MNRKAQGMSVNLIIIVAIGLIVLIIAVILINRSGRNLSENAANTCISKGGYCTTNFNCDNPSTDTRIDGFANWCPTTGGQTPQNQICCRYNFGGG